MSFNPDLNMQAQEVIFSRKLKEICHPPLRFNNNSVFQTSPQKHLVLTLDNRLLFYEHLTNVSNKITNSTSYNVFKNSILKFISPCPNKNFPMS